MCGIAGLVASEPFAPTALFAMSAAVAHRGPDDDGTFVSADGRVGLAHRRLAIIDLSPAGHQPMATADGQSWITYNGEIYNFRDLRTRLEGLGHRFRTQTDTEVILSAYAEWGTQALRQFRGMFAFAIWDARRRVLFAARDQTGIKPLFYYWDGRTFAFASELSAFKGPEWDLTIDRTAIFDYLTYLRIPAPKTAYARIAKLPAGHWLEFNGRDVRTGEYWDVPLTPDDAMDEPRAIRQTTEAIDEAVRLSLVADVPVGIFLSGGLDSSTIVASASRLVDHPLATYSIGFDRGFNEAPFAREVAEAFRTEHHERILSGSTLRSLLPLMGDLYGEPFADGSAMPTYEVSRLAREDVKVVLAGDGGDEVFAGYTWHARWMARQRHRAIPGPIRRGVMGPAGRLWPPHARGGRVKRWLEDVAYEPFEQYARQLELFSPSEKRAVLRPDWCPPADYDDYWNFRRYWRDDVDPITRVQYLDLKTYLPDDILTKVDRASMRVALEVRPPLLDPPLVELAFRIPAAIRFKNGVKKSLMKEAMGPRLPARVVSRRKQGFSSPLMDWIGAERPWVTEQLAHPRLLQSTAAQTVSGHLWGPKVWALLLLERFACEF